MVIWEMSDQWGDKLLKDTQPIATASVLKRLPIKPQALNFRDGLDGTQPERQREESPF